MASNPSETLASLYSLQSTPLTIIRLSEPLSSPAPTTRTSDISTSSLDSPTPATHPADLTHNKEHFNKLPFSYLEKIHTEKFLRAIVGDPPLIVEHGENIELEAQLKEVKEVLRSQKQDVARMVEELEGRGREMARRE